MAMGKRTPRPAGHRRRPVGDQGICIAHLSFAYPHIAGLQTALQTPVADSLGQVDRLGRERAERQARNAVQATPEPAPVAHQR
jgi:hypothetical protein